MTVEIERKTATAFLKELDGKGAGLARIATLRVIDHDGDWLAPGAIGEQVVPVQPMHRWDVPAVGKARVYEDGDDVLASFALNLRAEGGRELYESMKFDLAHPPSRQSWSFGFKVGPNGAQSETLDDGRRVRVLKKLVLFEVSPVLLAASINTGTLALKGAATSEDYDREALLTHLQSLPPEQQEHWFTQAQALCAEARVLLLDIAFDGLTAGKQAYRYVHTDPWDGRVFLAQDVMAEACAELGCGLPKAKAIRFFTSCDQERADFVDEPLDGFCTKTGEIGLSWNLGLEQLVQVAAHEAGHLAGMDEPEAALFGEDFARRHAAKFLSPAPAVNPMEALWALSVLHKWYGPVVPHIRV